MLTLHSHKPSILHRDLKSPNLLVDRHLRIKVTDINLSSMIQSTSDGTSCCSSVASNPRWLAPEVLSRSQRAIPCCNLHLCRRASSTNCHLLCCWMMWLEQRLSLIQACSSSLQSKAQPGTDSKSALSHKPAKFLGVHHPACRAVLEVLNC